MAETISGAADGRRLAQKIMKTNSPTMKTMIAVIAVALVAAAVYFYYQGGSPPAGSGSMLTSQSGPTTVGAAELSLLSQIQGITFETSVFQNPAYLSLKDYTVVIPAENVGRPDPFAPIPGLANQASAGNQAPAGNSLAPRQ